MSIEEIIRAWKAGKSEELNQHLPENPIGDELSEKELAEAVGGQAEQEWNALPNTSRKTVDCPASCMKRKK